MAEAAVKLVNITKSFGQVKANSNVSLEINKGEILALLGENGSGKTTLMNMLSGIYYPDEGQIFIDGKEVAITDVNSARDNGISIIHQELVLVPRMTVAENIFLGREPRGKFGVDKGKMIKDAQKMLDNFNVGIAADMEIADLTIAKQQMVEIVKAISFNCRILVMDEPTSSIADKEVQALFGIMHDLTQRGVGIIYISHKMSEIFEICDRVTVLRDGTYIDTRVVAETTRDELVSLMVGRELDQYYVRDHVDSDEVVLRCTHINDGKKMHSRVKDVSFELHKGEILGFSGLVGAGRSETMQCIFGLTKGSRGDIELEGQKVSIRSAVDAMNYGIAMVPEDRKKVESELKAARADRDRDRMLLMQHKMGLVNQRMQPHIDAMRQRLDAYARQLQGQMMEEMKKGTDDPLLQKAPGVLKELLGTIDEELDKRQQGIETLETSIKKETESIVIKLAKERGYSIVFHKYRTNVAADDVTGDVISGLKKLGARAEAAEALNKKTAGSSTGK